MGVKRMPAGGGLEERIHRVGKKLYSAMQAEYKKLAQRHRWEYRILRWCLKDPPLRTQILRFIDCLASLKDPFRVVQHIREYFPKNMRLPIPLRIGIGMARPSVLTASLVEKATRLLVSSIARLFLAGSNLEEAFLTISQMEREGFSVSVDLLGETTVSQSEADRYTQRYLELITRWKSALNSSPHVSLKLSSLAFPFDPVDPEGAWRQINRRLGSILQAATSLGGFVNVDMEQYHGRDLVLELTQRIIQENLPNGPEVGVVIQAYLKDAHEVTQRLLDWVNSQGIPLTVRLVRGAYWDSEVILSRQRGWPCPVFTSKNATDRSFEQLTDLLLQNHPKIRIAIATHNIRSIARAIVRAEEFGVPRERWECQVLYGMGEAIQRAILSLGFPVRVYCPVGELIPGMAYLVRRILENTSHTSFLAMSLMENRPFKTLMEVS